MTDFVRSLAVFQLKGGVGKTTTAVNIAALAAAEGIRTLVWDLDPQGAATWCLGAEPDLKQDKVWRDGLPIGRYIHRTPYDRLDVLAADISLRKFHQSVADKRSARETMSEAIDMLGEDYGLVIVDCPPMIWPQIEGVLQSVDRILVPVEPSRLSIRAYEQSRQQLEWVKKRQWLPFVTLIDRRKQAHVTWVNETAPNIEELLPVFIAYSASAERMLEQRAPVVSCLPHVPMSRNYRALWEAIKQKLPAT
tara:strand:- start:501 stop:1250 length:750 start_codon:yes stop_codon:yes gene_type:complete